MPKNELPDPSIVDESDEGLSAPRGKPSGVSPRGLGLTDAEMRDEFERILGESEINREKARLLVPFSWAVFGFACVYCVAIFAVVFADGLGWVEVDRIALRILAGSITISAVSIILTILIGLFRSR